MPHLVTFLAAGAAGTERGSFFVAARMSDFIRRSKRKRTAAATGNGPFPSKPSTWDFGEGGKRSNCSHAFCEHRLDTALRYIKRASIRTYWLARGCSRRSFPPRAMAAVPGCRDAPEDADFVVRHKCPRLALADISLMPLWLTYVRFQSTRDKSIPTSLHQCEDPYPRQQLRQ